MAERYFLRLGGHTIPLSEGENVLGRSTSCDVVVPEEIASRRHAAIVIMGNKIFIEDLGSRNGVLVDGRMIAERARLDVGSRISIGNTRMVVTKGKVSTTERALHSARQAAEDSVADTKRGDVFGMLVRECKLALDDGRIADAEFATGNLLISMQAGLSRGVVPRESIYRVATEYALLLAEHTGDHDWLDRLLSLFAETGRVLDADAINRIEFGMVQPGSDAVQHYVNVLREHAPALAPDEIAYIQRIESLSG
ncbi:MAG: FHA domain-containing protein [Myxococcota bacterium]